MSACARTVSWKEEVLLHDGSKVIVTRAHKLGGYPTIDSRERALIEEEIIFSIPNQNKKINWTMSFSNNNNDLNGLSVLAINVINNIPYIATYPAGCIAYNKWKRPNPPYVFFKYINNQWKIIQLNEFPSQISKTNIIVGRPPKNLLKGFYTWQEVNDQNHLLDERYRTIIREPLEKVEEGCPEMISDGHGGWMGMGWFTSQLSYEECLNVCKGNNISEDFCPCKKLFKGDK